MMMESISLMFYLEIGLIVLLLAGLIYMHIINKKLTTLKNGGDGFKAVVIELNHATDNAQLAIQGLKLTVRDAEHGLDGNLKEARSIAEELKYLLDQAKIYGDGIDPNNNRNLPQMSQNVRNTVAATVPQNRAKNFADQTLEKVTRQKQNLPNPIVHSSSDRYSRRTNALEPSPELGVNLEPAHKEMALESRNMMLKSIAAKKAQTNERFSTTKNELGEQRLQPTTQNQNLARNTPTPRPRPANNQPLNNRQTNAGQVNTRPNNVPQHLQPKNVPAQNRQDGDANQQNASNLSLSDMVGRHAALERQTFSQADEIRSAKDDVTEQATRRDKSGGQEKSLFQRLSETR